MKLGELKSAIRTRKGNPSVVVALVTGAEKIAVTVQKASILEPIDAVFPGGLSAQTGLWLNDEAQIIIEGAPHDSGDGPASDADRLDDMDSLDELYAPAAADDLDELDEL